MTPSDHLRRIRFWLAVFIIGLVLSGITAFPLETELSWIVIHPAYRLAASDRRIHRNCFRGSIASTTRFPHTNARYPFLAYGTDWLAFAHLVIAVAFIGPYIDPVRNKWIITFGLIACAGVIPLALIAGPIRGIPFPWRLIDCSFGIFGGVPLLFSRQSILALEAPEGDLSSSPLGPLRYGRME